MSKPTHFSTLYSMHIITPDEADDNIEQLFECVRLDGVVALLTRTADGGMLASTHLTKYRTH
jgi:hypothetical protein